MRANRSCVISVRLTPQEMRALQEMGAASEADAVRSLIFEHQNNQALAEELYERLQDPLARMVQAEVRKALAQIAGKVEDYYKNKKGAA